MYVLEEVPRGILLAADPGGGSAFGKERDALVALVFFSSDHNLYKTYGHDTILRVGARDCASGRGLGAHPVIF